jgi:hypothetical protein
MFVDFDQAKITDAIYKAGSATEEYTIFRVSKTSFPETSCSTYNQKNTIKDETPNVLKKYKTLWKKLYHIKNITIPAKAYILYSRAAC